MKVEDKKTILLVEDQLVIALYKQKELENCGYEVLTTATGEKALELIKENVDIDLILMDIDLGSGIDGTETAELILRDKDTPIVFLSSHSESEIEKMTKNITSYGYVDKRSNIAVLNASIKMAIGVG